MFRELWSRLESSLHGRDLEREMDEEMRFHLAMQVEKNRTEGLSVAEARRLARRDFGGPLQVKEGCRDARHTWLDSLWHDVRYALRGFRRDRAFTATVVLTLGLAIGAATSVFTILDNTLFRPLPYDRPDRVVMLMGRSPASGQLFETLGKEQAAALRRGRSLAVVANYSLFSTRLRLQLPGSAEPESIRAAGASADLLAVLGVSTAIGRAFGQDDGAAVGPRAVILTFGFWQRRLGGDRSAIGREIVLKHDSLTELTGPATIVGVMPASFQYPRSVASQQPDLLFAEHVDWELPPAGNERFVLLGRLKDGVSLREAQADADIAAAAAAATASERERATRFAVLPLRSQMVANYHQTLFTVLGAVLFLLLIACVNVANLMVARGGARGREFAIRSSLGAGRGRIARQVLTESALAALAGAGVGVLVSHWTLDALMAQLPGGMRIFEDVGVNGRVLSFTAFVTVISVVVFGGTPALGASTPGVMNALKTGSRRPLVHQKSRAGSVLLSVEVALALVLLVGAGLLLNSFVRMQRVDLGFDPGNILALSVNAPPVRYATDEQALQLFDQARARVRALPGVRAVSTGDDAPFSGALWGSEVAVEGHAPEQEETRRVSGQYFETLGIPALAGRLIARSDEQSEPVAVVNESMAKKYWSVESAVGRTMTVWQDQPVRVVGVVRDFRTNARMAPGPAVYVSYDRTYRRFRYRTMIVRVVPGPGDVSREIAAELRRIDRELTPQPQLLTDWLAQVRVSPRFYALIYGAFAAIGLLLASVGIAGVAAHSVVRKTHEIGVRLALGSSRAGVVRMVARQVIVPIGLGVVAGLAGAAALTTTLTRLLFDLEPHDPPTYFLVVLVLGAVAVVATWLPARRAARVSPIDVLRAD